MNSEGGLINGSSQFILQCCCFLVITITFIIAIIIVLMLVYLRDEMLNAFN